LLPLDARTWNEAELSRALVHELEHVRRRDWLTHCLTRGVCALYWFHPLVWIARRQLGLEAERACDDAVLRRSEATAYADQLVGIAERFSSSAKPPLLAMANRADLAKRVRAVLDRRQSRGRAGRFPVFAAGAIASALVLTMSPLSVVALPQSAETDRRAGQSTANTPFRFESAFIQPSPPDFMGNTLRNNRDRFEVRNWPVSWMISYAYFIHGAQLTARPDWIDQDRFDITATPDRQQERESETGPGRLFTRDQRGRSAVRALLAERFQLRLRQEIRAIPVYSLVVDPDGHKLSPSPTGAGNILRGSENGDQMMRLEGYSLNQLADALNASLDHPVVNETGLNGLYDCKLTWPGSFEANPNDGFFFKAVREQLGLSLVLKVAPVNIYVIEHVVRPE